MYQADTYGHLEPFGPAPRASIRLDLGQAGQREAGPEAVLDPASKVVQEAHLMRVVLGVFLETVLEAAP